MAAIGDFVWLDRDADGVQDAGEAGVAGVTVRLLDGAMNVLASTTTATGGTYSFTNLASGDYRVEFVAPPSRGFTLQDAGVTTDALDSDVDPTTGRTGMITLGASDNLSVDAGLILVPAVGIPRDLKAIPGGKVTASVTISDATNVAATDLTIKYDPALLSTSEAQIRVGTIWRSGPIFAVNNTNPGTIIATIGHSLGARPIQGTVLEIEFNVAATAVIGASTAVDLARVVVDGNAANDRIFLAQTPQPGPDPTDGQITFQTAEVNTAPTDILVSNLSVPENAPGMVIGAVTVVDANAGQTHTFTLSDSRFQILAGQLRLAPGISLDFEAGASIPLQIQATDSGTPPLSFTKSFSITVQNLNEPPTAIALNPSTIQERVSGASVGTLTAMDPDAGQTHSFRLASLDSPFEIVNTTLRLKPDQFLRLSQGNTVSVNITASDSDSQPQSLTQSVLISVLSNEWPWRNGRQPLDVSGDDHIVPGDVLIVINELNAQNLIDSAGRLPYARPSTVPYYYDVNGDGFLSPAADALTIINFLNAGQGGEGAAASAPRIVAGGSVMTLLSERTNGNDWFLDNVQLEGELAAAPAKIAFVTSRNGKPEIYAMNPDGSGQTRLTNNDYEDAWPAFSLDASRLAFNSDRDGNFEIYVMNADGSGQTRLTNNTTTDKAPSFHPSGEKIAFASTRDGNYEIYVMNANGTSQTRLTNSIYYDDHPQFSPDGSKIVFTSERFSSGTPHIWLMNADGTGAMQLTSGTAKDQMPVFSPDGAKIAFSSFRDGNWEIYVMNADGSNQTRLTNNSGPDEMPVFSPDGSRIAFASNRDGDYEIYVMNSDGTGATALTSNTTFDWYPTWGGVAPVSLPPTSVDLAAASDTGVSATDNVTNLDNSHSTKRLEFVVSGTVGGATVTVYAGGKGIGSAVATGTSTTVITNGTDDLTDGNHSITARQVEPGKVGSGASPSLALTVDTTAPTAPIAPDLVAASDTGYSNVDNVTRDNTPTFAVSGAPYFRLSRGGVKVSGDYESGSAYTSSVLADGVYVFRVAAVDSAGNQSPWSSGLTVTVDTVPPTLTNWVPERNATIRTATVDIDVRFSESVYGVDAGDMTLGGTAAGSVGTPAKLTGNTWRFPIAGLREGELSISLAPDDGDVEDAAGNNLTPAPTEWSYPVDLTLAVSSFAPTSGGFIAEFREPLNLERLNLHNVETGAADPPDVTLIGDATGPVAGSLIVSATKIIYVASGGPLLADTYTVRLRSAEDAFQQAVSGELLDGNADGIPGDDYVGTFLVAAPTSVVVSLPDFTRGPGQSVDVPATSHGLPLTVSDGFGIQSLDLTLHYDPALLGITGASLGPDAPADATLAADTTVPGRLTLRYAASTPLAAGPSTWATLAAQVPITAHYGAAHVLAISEVVVNAGQQSAVADEAIHLAVYFGDTTGDQDYSGLDAQRIARVVVGLDTGFAAFPLVDPVVVADVTGNGELSGLDAVLVARQVVGLDAPEIPPLPSGRAFPPATTAQASSQPAAASNAVSARPNLGAPSLAPLLVGAATCAPSACPSALGSDPFASPGGSQVGRLDEQAVDEMFGSIPAEPPRQPANSREEVNATDWVYSSLSTDELVDDLLQDA